MKRVAGIGLLIVLLGVAFALGYGVRDRLYPADAELEDYALANLLSELAYVHYLQRAENDEMRRLIDVNIYGHLSRVRLRQGATKDPEFLTARTRTLAKVGDLWDKEPPFQTADFAKNQSWFSEWQEGLENNKALVAAAQAECQKTDCNRPNHSVEGSRGEAARPSVR